MKIALVQMKIALGAPEANRRKAAAMVREAASKGADTVVLPETWNLGFFPKDHLQELAEIENGASWELLSQLASENKVNLVGGSIITRKESGIYNTAYIMDRSGHEIASYDKMHSFSPSGEHLYFQHGKHICTFQLDGFKAGIILCYDLRFCELSRMLALEEIQILFVPAAWPYPRQEHWQILNKARAIENQIYVACVNGCGSTEDLDFCGNSMVIGPFGETLADSDDEECIIYAEVDFTEIAAIRNKINVFRDRKPDLYDLK